VSSVISEIKKDFIYNLLIKGERIDGRKFDQYREISIERDVIRKAEGSALVKLGSSQVLVGVKMQPGEPFQDSPNRGVIITNAELVPWPRPLSSLGRPMRWESSWPGWWIGGCANRRRWTLKLSASSRERRSG